MNPFSVRFGPQIIVKRGTGFIVEDIERYALTIPRPSLARTGGIVYWLGEQAKQDAIGYATPRAKLNANFRLEEYSVRASIATEAW